MDILIYILIGGMVSVATYYYTQYIIEKEDYHDQQADYDKRKSSDQ